MNRTTRRALAEEIARARVAGGGRGGGPGPGSGRFKRMKRKVARRKGVRDPGALAAYIGRRAYGAEQMAKWAAQGRRRKRR